MSKNLPGKSQFIIYQTENGETKIDVRFEDETVWLTQDQMAELFQRSKSTINEHISNTYTEKELVKDETMRKFGNSEFATKPSYYYNLDIIISIGYRVKSLRGTQFRIWATKRLREYIIKGFVLDDERLKNPDQPFDYFDELIRRIQDIRTSERRFYQKITDIYATSVDYDPTDEMSINFFTTVQNKMHWAITGKTAAQIIHERVDSSKPNMGLTNWRGEKVRKQDVAIAKNYLDEKELSALNNLVEQYLIFAEGQAMRRVPMHMKDWISKLHAFLELNERDILKDVGRVSHQLALDKAESEYEKFQTKRIEETDKKPDDFDETVKRIESKRDKK